MTSITSSHNYNSLIGFQEHFYRESFYKVPCSRCFLPFSPSGRFCFPHGLHHSTTYSQTVMKTRPIFSSTVDDGNTIDPDNSDDATIDKGQSESGGINNEMIRENLERIVGRDDSTFSGLDLATLIRKKYGRSYDVQLIKKRSFPLTEEEYILRLDDVANTLKCWGAVSHIRNSLEKSKERPRIGKAVSIFIDMDESGGRANEWIYK